MKNEKNRLEKHIAEVYEKYSRISDATASVILSPDKWSIKEIFGHLIDSAANNYQRFVRLQETESLTFPGYDFNWIKIIKYNSYPYSQLLELWKQYNLLICHIIGNIDVSKLKNCWILNAQNHSLEFLVKDYIDHLELHLEQLVKRSDEVIRHISDKT